MLWIRVDSEFDRHPKTLKLKRLLADNKADVYPQRLWRWAIIHAPAGDLSGFDVADIASAVGFDADANSLIEALIHAGFLDTEPLQIHDWQDHSGQYEVRTMQGRIRKARYDERKRNAEVTLRNAHVTLPVREGVREERSKRKIKTSSSPESQKTNGSTTSPPAFDAFWSAYPRKVGKGAALKSWSRIKPDTQLQHAILEAISQQRSSPNWTRDSGQFIPHPSTWLNQQRWLDEPVTDTYNPGAF